MDWTGERTRAGQCWASPTFLFGEVLADRRHACILVHPLQEEGSSNHVTRTQTTLSSNGLLVPSSCFASTSAAVDQDGNRLFGIAPTSPSEGRATCAALHWVFDYRQAVHLRLSTRVPGRVAARLLTVVLLVVGGEI